MHFPLSENIRTEESNKLNPPSNSSLNSLLNEFNEENAFNASALDA